MFPGHKIASLGLGNRRPCNLPVRGLGQGLFACDHLDQLLATRELSISDRSLGLRIGHSAVRGRQSLRIHFQALRGHINQHLACGSGHCAQLRPHGRSGAAAECAHVPGSEVGVAHGHRDGVKRYSQLLGDKLRQRGANVLPNFNFPCKYRYLAIGSNVQPRAHILGKLLPAEGAARLLRPRQCGREANQQSASQHLHEIAAIQLRAAQPARFVLAGDFKRVAINRDHRLAPLLWSRAASFTASTMRGYVPQRQMFPSIAWTICSSLGSFFSRSKEVAWTTMPEVQ